MPGTLTYNFFSEYIFRWELNKSGLLSQEIIHWLDNRNHFRTRIVTCLMIRFRRLVMYRKKGKQPKDGRQTALCGEWVPRGTKVRLIPASATPQHPTPPTHLEICHLLLIYCYSGLKTFIFIFANGFQFNWSFNQKTKCCHYSKWFHYWLSYLTSFEVRFRVEYRNLHQGFDSNWFAGTIP